MDSFPAKPTSEEVKEWDNDKLVRWIQLRRRGLLEGDNLEKFRAAFIRGRAFVEYGRDVGFFNGCNLPYEISYELADLAANIVGRETAGMKSKLLPFISCTPRLHQTRHADSQLTTSQGTVNKAGLRGR